ncbi:hypothetical protein EZJ49_05300 [Bdellovibrio bacteriovorus]|uniref:hypothetical protein n=1 Tax=Bdellovibrio bacteriovorus TaxID=959 RepID=UPI0021D017EB|nr:hypothetical protein [Bdellovibrio bacteriovorus]UXR65664.1 hypothetical protein EZJ49_05300 [Bdellovibrio bacteriovorus]
MDKLHFDTKNLSPLKIYRLSVGYTAKVGDRNFYLKSFHNEPVGDEDCTEDRYSGQTRCGLINLRCVSQPTNGEDGEDGPNGTNGENGSDGGDTGNLFVQIEDHTNFALKLSIKPGLGGLGGQGAPGKIGGKGGKAGALDQQKVCKPASKGKDGATGKPGRTGENGQPGKVGTIELNGLKNAIIE